MNFLQKIKNRWYSSHRYQKQHWNEYIKKGELDSWGGVGFEWGDPNRSNDRHGDYLAVRNLLISKINTETVVLEIGALTGKWIEFMAPARKIIAVDIGQLFEKYLLSRYSEYNNLECYVSSGDELDGIGDSSVNLVFSMDTFSRVKKKFIVSYFKEINRVLTKNGEAIIFLPNSDLFISKNRGFTNISTQWIQNKAEVYFSDFTPFQLSSNRKCNS